MEKRFNISSILNDGERLIPFISHDDAETVRHLSSHFFFRDIINKDANITNNTSQSVLDLGFGTGYASFIYANLDTVGKVKSIDVSDELLEWAIENYFNKKIDYEIRDAVKYLKNLKQPYNYVVTRHVLEHIKDGLNIISENNFSDRLLINVPYNEKKGNPHHIITGITEKNFPKFNNVEFFYEDLDGNTYNRIPKGIFINSIICIASKPGLPKVSSYFKFPIKSARITEIYQILAKNNYNFIDNILRVQLSRGLNYKSHIVELDELKVKYSTLITENHKLKNEFDNLKSKYKLIESSLLMAKVQIDEITSSKRWKYSSKIIDMIRKLQGQ